MQTVALREGQEPVGICAGSLDNGASTTQCPILYAHIQRKGLILAIHAIPKLLVKHLFKSYLSQFEAVSTAQVLRVS